MMLSTTWVIQQQGGHITVSEHNSVIDTTTILPSITNTAGSPTHLCLHQRFFVGETTAPTSASDVIVERSTAGVTRPSSLSKSVDEKHGVRFSRRRSLASGYVVSWCLTGKALRFIFVQTAPAVGCTPLALGWTLGSACRCASTWAPTTQRYSR